MYLEKYWVFVNVFIFFYYFNVLFLYNFIKEIENDIFVLFFCCKEMYL